MLAVTDGPTDVDRESDADSGPERRPFWRFVPWIAVPFVALALALAISAADRSGPEWVTAPLLIAWLGYLVAYPLVVVGYAVARRFRRFAAFERIKTYVLTPMFGVCLLTLILLPMVVGINARARTAKAQADVRSIASAVSMYAAHTGSLPKSLEDLTKPSRNEKGETSGAFLAWIPKPPPRWPSAYSYVSSADGTFTISASGDATTARVP